MTKYVLESPQIEGGSIGILSLSRINAVINLSDVRCSSDLAPLSLDGFGYGGKIHKLISGSFTE